MRDAVIGAASTLQYDSAVLAAKQLGVDVPPEPFTERQQRQSRFDGGVEEDGHVRDLVPVTGEAKQGHIVREELAAVSEQRPLRDAYKAIPLTGAQQSMLPSYRLATRFMKFTALDENGLVPEDGAQDARVVEKQSSSEHFTGWVDATAPFICDTKGEVLGFKTPSGTIATEQELAADALEWSKSFARDARSCHAVNHNHDCTDSCTKKAKKTESAQKSLPENMKRKLRSNTVPLCRFRYFRVIVMQTVNGVRKLLRRGKALVRRPCVSTDTESNDYGRIVPVQVFQHRCTPGCSALQR